MYVLCIHMYYVCIYVYIALYFIIYIHTYIHVVHVLYAYIYMWILLHYRSKDCKCNILLSTNIMIYIFTSIYITQKSGAYLLFDMKAIKSFFEGAIFIWLPVVTWVWWIFLICTYMPKAWSWGPCKPKSHFMHACTYWLVATPKLNINS